MITARSPQAKGMVERSNKTFQDRLVKALRRKGISIIAEANNYLQKSFIEEYNRKFAVNPEARDVHRSADGYKLQKIFCYKTQRQVKNNYTINLSGGYIQLLKSKAPLRRLKQKVTVSKWSDGQIHIYFNDQEINFTQLSGKPEKTGYKTRHVSKDHPWRKMNEHYKYTYL